MLPSSSWSRALGTNSIAPSVTGKAVNTVTSAAGRSFSSRVEKSGVTFHTVVGPGVRDERVLVDTRLAVGGRVDDDHRVRVAVGDVVPVGVEPRLHLAEVHPREGPAVDTEEQVLLGLGRGVGGLDTRFRERIGVPSPWAISSTPGKPVAATPSEPMLPSALSML